ncbi:peptidase S8/S53 domain-containing protein [Pilobolus umbonatus]|nr:peptidase S8/S53 domain-containing protein [Pilobolus umbonatus]
MLRLTTAIVLLLSCSLIDCHYTGKRDPGRDYYTIHVPDGDEQVAAQISHDLGTQFEGRVGEIDTYYMLSAPQSRKRDDPVLSLFHEYQHKTLSKRDSLWSRVKTIDKQVPKKRVKRGPIPPKDKVDLTAETLGIKDPMFREQWHLINTVTPGNDINVTGVWEQGITGKGINVAILDDGLDYESEDLIDNFFAEGSYDFNLHDPMPKPRLWDDNHGTRCAGQIAAGKNNACGVGIAYDSKVAGIRILSGDLTDVDEALALNYKYQENHIFSCSWGPPDNGETMEAPYGILSEAFKNGIKKGRDGKGSIYVFATGNGATSGDNCNFDGYTNSIYTITVGAIDHLDQHPPYSESCSAQLVHTTNVGKNDCTDRHGGTSAAAPNAVGIFALVLSVRPELTWRDLQHLCVQTAVPVTLDDPDWKVLPSGRSYNHKFGYGKLDAYALVEAAKSHELVNKQTWMHIDGVNKKRVIPDSSNTKTKKPLKDIIEVTEEMVTAAGLLRLEHITATVNINHDRRGDIVIHLISPHGIQSELATRRNADRSKDGIQNWKFMSVKHWEEDPVGNWTLNVYDLNNPDETGHLLNWTLSLFGELDPAKEETPVHSVTDIVSTPIATEPATVTEDTNDTQDSISPSQEGTKVEDSHTGSTLIYAAVGSLFIFALATGIYFFHRHQWSQPEHEDKAVPHDGYEFDEFHSLTDIEEEEDDDEVEDSRRLLGNHN